MLAFILPILASLKLSQIVAALPEIIKAVELGITIYKDLIANGGLQKDEASAQAALLVGKAVTKLVADLVGAVVPLPHRMTPDEERLWQERASAVSG